ncbi:protein of unknown function [Tenacibaculum sp. 190524A02b]|uniref:hypothetical protein n=1 Tax=Tenacibaculum vairaonense TaxID=3137860 RepID=UPI0032B210CA
MKLLRNKFTIIIHMKNKLIQMLFLSVLLLNSIITKAQENQENKDQLTGYYLGFEDDKYKFLFTEEATGEKETIFFNQVTNEVVSKIDLSKEYYHGVKFIITYKIIENSISNQKKIYRIINLKEIDE